VADAHFIDEKSAAVGILERLNKRKTAKKHRLYRLSVATGVTLAHLLVAVVIIQTKYLTVSREKPPVETQLLWLLLPRASVSPGHQSEVEAEKMVRSAYKAVQLLPRVNDSPQPSNAITLDPGLALGQALACGAGRFEYQTREGQLRCVTKPWNFTYDRYGYIILDLKEHQRKPEKPRPSDVMAHQRNTAPPCPQGADPNSPCLSRIIRGN
jgi:hypothetical protein